MCPSTRSFRWVLGCYTQFGELSRMTQFKDKAAKHADNITAGLFTYPVLMAADILALSGRPRAGGSRIRSSTSSSAATSRSRFNGVYGDTFTLPEPFIPKMGARVMSLGDPDEQDVQVRPRRLRLT